jgi:Tol biopolymer transport system component
LTRFRFFQMSSPFYLPDDKRFIFAAEWPESCPGNPDCDYDSMMKAIKEYKTRYKENNIFLMGPGEETLKPYIEGYLYSGSPMLSADGKVLIFKAREPATGDRPTHFSYQFYVYSPDGKHRCFTKISTSSVWSSAVSFAGDQLAVVHNIDSEPGKSGIVIYRVGDGSSKEILLPDEPPRIINYR